MRPAADDNHALWIDPSDSLRMMMATATRAALISMDGGKSWSLLVQTSPPARSTISPPTIAIRIGSTALAQQDSGSVGTLSAR